MTPEFMLLTPKYTAFCCIAHSRCSIKVNSVIVTLQMWALRDKAHDLISNLLTQGMTELGSEPKVLLLFPALNIMDGG